MRRSVLQKSVLIPIIALVFTCFSGLNSVVTHSLSPVYTPFPDVLVSHPAFTPITFFENIGAVDGYPDGLFRPANLLNRAEAAKIIYLVNYEVRPSYMNCYKDVFKKDWFSPYVCWGNFINGYGDGYFRPGQNVNFGEALKMMYVSYTGNYPRVYDVLSSGPWYNELIVQAKVDGYIPSTISGSEFINRAQFLDILYKFYQEYGSDTDSTLIQRGGDSSGGSSRRIGSKYKNSGDDDDNGDDDDDTGDDDDDDTGDDDDDDTGDDDDDTGDLIITPPNFKVAFFGDGALNDRYSALLQTILDQGADMVVQVGDIVNSSREDYPEQWYNLMSPIMDANGTYPYFYSMGNNDEDEWIGSEGNVGWQELLQDRFDDLGLSYNGLASELGVKTSFEYEGLFVTLTAPGSGENFAGNNHETFIDNELTRNNHLWEICGWHKLMGEVDEELYETCREHGALIINGHKHSYGRTHILDNMEDGHVADNTSPYTLQPGQTFTAHIGTGGKSLSSQSVCNNGNPPYPVNPTDCDSEWAGFYNTDSVYNYEGEEYIVRDIINGNHPGISDSDPYMAGALFIEFYVDGDPRKARAQYINAAGHIVEEFEIYNHREDGDSAPEPEPTPEPEPEPGPTPVDDLIITPPNFKVAFFGDASLYDRTQNVYDLVVSEGTDMVIHQGDIVNDEDEEYPREWLNMMSGILDTHGTFPYFYSMGNHDEDDWLGHGNYIGYQEILQDRFDALNINYNGLPSELGGKTSFEYNGLFVTLTAPGSGEDFAGDNHAEFLEEELGNSNNLWQICSWHRMMREMQTGSKGDETGWEVYEACRENGAIIANGHEHEYARTHVLSDMSEQTVFDNTSPYIIQPGQTFSFHAGTGGKDLRDQDRCEHSDGPPYPLHQDGCAEWAVIYSRESVYYYDSNGDGIEEEYVVQDIIDHEDDDVSDLYFGGVLFIEFYVDGDPRKARAYYKNTAGHVLDEFEIYNNREVTGPEPDDGDDDDDDGGDDVPADFVYADGTDLMLDGEEFKFMGANVYGAANSDIYSCGPYGYGDDGMDSEAFLRSMFENFKDNGMNVMRFWAFQAFTDNGTDFSALDRLFELANEYDIKVIPTLENQWDHCPENIYKDSDWYADGYKHPYGEYDLSYLEYVERVVTRYKNEPAILMWQMMNEAESDDAQALLNFTRDIARLIKGIDSNHMVNLGTMATGQAGTANQNLVNLHSLTDPALGRLIDILEIHDYDHEDEAWPSSGSNSVSRAASVANDLDMPFFVGEAGIQVGGGTTHEERADLFDNKFREFFAHGGAGYLIWRWSNDEYDEGCSTGNCLTVGDPLLEVMRSYLE